MPHAIASERSLNTNRVFSKPFSLGVRAENFLNEFNCSLTFAYPSHSACLYHTNFSPEDGILARGNESFDVRLDERRRGIFLSFLLEIFPA